MSLQGYKKSYCEVYPYDIHKKLLKIKNKIPFEPIIFFKKKNYPFEQIYKKNPFEADFKSILGLFHFLFRDN